MKGNLIKFFVVVFIAFGLQVANSKIAAQNGFQLLFETTVPKSSNYTAEDVFGNYIVVGSIQDSIDGFGKNIIWKISHNGADVNSVQIDLGQEPSSFEYIENNSDSTYLIIGISGDSTNRTYSNGLIIIETDTSFNIRWIKEYTFIEFLYMTQIRVIKDFFGYYIMSNISKINDPYTEHPFFCRINNEGDTTRTKIFSNYSSLTPIHDAIFSSDSAHIWWFSRASTTPYASPNRRELDTLFNFTGEDALTLSVNGHLHAKLVSNSTFLLSCNYLINHEPQDEDIGLFVFNNNVEVLQFNHFGAIDTVDYPGRTKGIDFQDPDTIFYTGMKNVQFTIHPDNPSWIIVGQVNQNLQPRFERFYGGDAYYTPVSILATNDGGCLINSMVEYPNDDNDYFLIMKLDSDGLITNIDQLNVPLSSAIIYPNPAREKLVIELSENKALLYIFDVSGKILLQKSVYRGSNNVNINRIAAGFYLYNLMNYNGQQIQSGKIVKY